MRFSTIRAAGAVLLGALAATATARGQDKEDDEIKKLREDADKKAGEKEKPGPAKDDDVESIRKAADAEARASDDRGFFSKAINSVTENLNAFNPRMVCALDLVGRLATNHFKTVQGGRSPDDRISLREGELDLRADVDPYAKAVMIISVFEQDSQSYGIDIEEGYFTLETLPFGLRLKAGRYRIPFGRMNALHTHDLPQTTRPYALQDILGDDGWNDTGAQLSWLVPEVPIPLEFQAHVLNGENPQILARGRSNQPAYMGRSEVFFQITDVTWLSLGGAYLFGYNDTRGLPNHPHEPFQETQLAEADLLFKWQPDQFKSVVFIAEFYDVIKRDRRIAVDFGGGNIVSKKHHDEAQGAFLLLQVQPLQRWYFGLRGDWSNFDDARPGFNQWATSLWVNFYTTEFLRFRAGYEHRERIGGHAIDGPHERGPNDTVFFEVTWVFGSHPAEPFWVNK